MFKQTSWEKYLTATFDFDKPVTKFSRHSGKNKLVLYSVMSHH